MIIGIVISRSINHEADQNYRNIKQFT